MGAEPLVVATLDGGVGNQLFQYAAGLSIAHELGATLAVRGMGSTGARLTDYLGAAVQELTPPMLRQLALVAPLSPVPRAAQRLRRARRMARGQLQYVRQSRLEAYAARPSGIAGRTVSTVLLDGYFQHPSWFEPALQTIARQLKEHVTPDPVVVDGQGATVISFRRGDYVRLGWDLPLSYYEDALRLLPPSEGPIWVIGDDGLFLELAGGWLREQGLGVAPLPDLGLSPNRRDLVLLAASERVVMSNSSFCWWGVVAGDTDRTIGAERAIVAPRQWLPMAGSHALVRPSWQTVG